MGTFLAIAVPLLVALPLLYLGAWCLWMASKGEL